MKKTVIFLLVALLLAGCASVPEEAEKSVYLLSAAPVVDPRAEAAAFEKHPMPAQPVILQPEASGILEKRSHRAVIDHSNTADGYVMVRFLEETEKRLKVLVKGPNTTYNYNLPVGEWTVFPLSDGNGAYQIGVYENTTGSKYAAVLSASFEVQMQDEFAPFLRPNQYVDYAAAEKTVKFGTELTTGLEDPLDKVAAVYDYVVENFSYDYEKAASVKSGYLPKLDEILGLKKGICFDYAAVMTAMLRSQEIPCKLVVGYAGETYHAWISVWTAENGWIDGIIFFDGQVWKRMDPTFASSANRSEEIMDFIEHGNYRVKYLY